LSEYRKIGALYSKGPHFLRMLSALRKQHPDSEILAFVPPGYPPETLEGFATEVRVLPATTRSPGALLAITRDLREARLDALFIMFHSPRLRVLAALSGARSRECFTADGRHFPVSMNYAGDLVQWILRNLRGRLTYYRILWIVRTRRVQSKE